MDTRRTPGSRENAPVPERSSDAGPVELIELQSVAQSGRGFSQRALAAVAVAGIVLLAAIATAVKAPTPTSTPAPVPGVALATTSPTASTGPTIRPTIFTPTAPPPTIRPTLPPPWHWTRSDFLPDLRFFHTQGMWGVNDRVLALIRQFDGTSEHETWSIATLAATGEWVPVAAPPAIEELYGGSVIDGRLWFLAWVGGVTADDATWQLVSTADGSAWESLGEIDGLPPFVGPKLLGRAGDSWFVVTDQADGEGSSLDMISWSADGGHWQPADVPDLRANVEYVQMASIGDVTVTLGYDFNDPEDAGAFVLASTDGRTWSRTQFESPSTGSPQDLACNERTCLITGDRFDGATLPNQFVMLSADGDQWTEASIDVSQAGFEPLITRPRANGTGFMALSGYELPVLLSDDGVSWRAVEVAPPDAVDFFAEVAVAGDIIVGFAPAELSDVLDSIWIGSLEAMEAALRPTLLGN